MTKEILQLPKNKALIDNEKDFKSSKEKEKCKIHNKEIEIFCETDKLVLCVTCIVDNDHKNHDLSSIDKVT